MEKINASLSPSTMELRKQNLRNTFSKLNEFSSSLLLFSLQWKDLDDHYHSLHNALEKRGEEVHDLEESVQRRLRYLKGRFSDFEMKRSELGFLDESMKVMWEKIELKEYEFGEKMRLAIEVKGSEIEEKMKVFEGVKREIAERLEEIEERERLIKRAFEERDKELDKKERELKDLEHSWITVSGKSVSRCEVEVEGVRGFG